MNPLRPQRLALALILFALPAAAAPVSTGTEQDDGDAGKLFPETTLPPKDEAVAEPGLYRDRATLRRILAKKDAAALTGFLMEDVKVDFGGASGRDAFRKTWRLEEDPEASPVWREMSRALELGGVIVGEGEGEERIFVAPSLAVEFPDSIDAYGHGVITGTNVNVRAQPSLEGAVVAQLSHAVVRLDTMPPEAIVELTLGDETYPWRKITLHDGTTGYVWGKFVRSPLDFRLGMKESGGQWRIAFFLAGD